IPVACLGGFLALVVTGTPFSISAAVGFISIFGIAVMDGIVLSFYIRQLWEEGHHFAESIIMGSDRRLRANDDDGSRCCAWAPAGGAFYADRRPDSASSGDCRHRRSAGDHGPHTALAPGLNLSLSPRPPKEGGKSAHAWLWRAARLMLKRTISRISGAKRYFDH